ncbi:MAG: hypothetical protein J5698_07850 [Bacteroidaceae bacterium]|nr:hypothetical protein [Bacteroidaceae bacterium]
MASKNDDKHISGLTARKYLKCSKAKFEKLVKQGVIQAYRDEEMRWRVSKESVLNYVMQSQPAIITHLVFENHYQEIIERICAAKSSIKIMTGDFKRFKLKPTTEQGKNYNDETSFISFLMEKAKQGISVQIICSSPSKSFKEEYEELYEQMNPGPFKIFFCIRNHAKVVIIDDKVAYMGSANVTKAGLGQGIISPGNFEAGILTEETALVSSVKEFFTKILDGDYCDGCHRSNQCIEY